MKRNWLNYLPTIFVICIIVSLLAYNVQGNTVQMNYTQFESLSKHATFDDSSLDINDTVIKVSGTYDDTNKKVSIQLNIASLFRIPMKISNG